MVRLTDLANRNSETSIICGFMVMLTFDTSFSSMFPITFDGTENSLVQFLWIFTNLCAWILYFANKDFKRENNCIEFLFKLNETTMFLFIDYVQYQLSNCNLNVVLHFLTSVCDLFLYGKYYLCAKIKYNLCAKAYKYPAHSSSDDQASSLKHSLSLQRQFHPPTSCV